MIVTQKEKKELQVKKAAHGKGVFARKNFKEGQTIVHVKGKLVTCYEDDNLSEEDRSNTFRFDDEYFLSPKGRLGNFFNHACEPNSKVIKKDNKLFIIALISIAKGEEIVFDYSTILASDDVWEMECHCSAKLCRKTVKQFRTLPKKLRDKYLTLGMVPKHILEN
jgi:hypothetical protein